MYIDNPYKDIIKFTIQQPLHFFKKMTNFTSMHLQIKYAKLIKSKNQTYYNKLKNQSQKSIIVLNYTNGNGYDHKINAKATKQQAQNMKKSILQILDKNSEKSEQKAENTKALAFTATTSKLYYRTGQGFYHQYSKDFFPYQYNIIWKNQQFRINLNQRKIYKDNIKELISQIAGQQRIDCLRFKDQTDYKVSKHFNISISQIFQTQDDEICKQSLQAVQEDQNMDEFIKAMMKKHFGPNSKFEIQLKFTKQGCQHIKSLSGQQAGNFMGQCIEFFESLSKLNKEDQLTKLMGGLSIKQESKPVEKKPEIKKVQQESKPVEKKKKKYVEKKLNVDGEW